MITATHVGTKYQYRLVGIACQEIKLPMTLDAIGLVKGFKFILVHEPLTQ